ncbi:sodium:solute symporter [Ktedonobacteria bacterium brp13]|nr:sodium:solute symporter [Ktedonobacteria bacterium brp13]
MGTIDIPLLVVFIGIFVLVTILGFLSVRWHAGNLNRIQEWGLAGRRFGVLMFWFLLGGDVYTAYTYMAIPALLFSGGALGFYAVPYTMLFYPLFFVFLPRLWTLAKHRGYITAADFVRERFDSPLLALLVAITGLFSTMPYIALQMLGMQVVLAQMGVPVEMALFIAFLILAAYTYISGLRAPAMLAAVKNGMVWIVVILALVIAVPRLGGWGHIFASLPQSHVLLTPAQYGSYASLALGSAFALLLYPHILTGMLSSNSRKVLKRNAFLLPIYNLLLALICLLGYLAFASGIKPTHLSYQTNSILPAFFEQIFPGWFTGFAFAALVIGALVPASIMSIAAANLFTRNIYREYISPSCSEREESRVARFVSLVIKAGALIFISVFPSTLAVNLQLLGGIWILQTLPSVLIGLYTRWFHRWALICGWAVGIIVGTWLVLVQRGQSSAYPLTIGGTTISIYIALIALPINLLVCAILTLILRGLGVAAGRDVLTPADFVDPPFSLSDPKTFLKRNSI